MTRTRNTYSKEFKAQMISLIEGGKPRIEVINEYELRPSTLDRWIYEYKSPSNPNNPELNLSPEQREIAELKRELHQTQMERDILKQAALILGKK